MGEHLESRGCGRHLGGVNVGGTGTVFRGGEIDMAKKDKKKKSPLVLLSLEGIDLHDPAQVDAAAERMLSLLEKGK
jgi:hypothetical protein